MRLLTARYLNVIENLVFNRKPRMGFSIVPPGYTIIVYCQLEIHGNYIKIIACSCFHSLRKVSLQQFTSVVNASVQGSLQVCK